MSRASLSSTGVNSANGSSAAQEHAIDVAKDAAPGACSVLLAELGSAEGNWEGLRVATFAAAIMHWRVRVYLGCSARRLFEAETDPLIETEPTERVQRQVWCICERDPLWRSPRFAKGLSMQHTYAIPLKERPWLRSERGLQERGHTAQAAATSLHATLVLTIAPLVWVLEGLKAPTTGGHWNVFCRMALLCSKHRASRFRATQQNRLGEVLTITPLLIV